MDRLKILNNKLLSVDGLSFDDVLLLPNYADFKRQEVDLTTTLHPKIILKLPVVSSPMDTVTEEKMAIALGQNGGLGVIHRNLTITKQASIVKIVKKTKVKNYKIAAVDIRKKLLVSAAVGVGPDFEERVRKLINEEVDVITIDSGHGYSKFIIEAVAYIKKNYPETVVMAGNVATYDGAKALINAGTDILRVGMGPGSICTTRIITGMGVPQITTIIETVKATVNTQTTVVADGGIRQIGDMAKALAFGAKAVMLGSLLARFKESPGKVVKIKGKLYKQYRAMGSLAAMKKGGAERYEQTRKTEEKRLITEGVDGLVEFKGPVENYLYQINGSLKSSFYYLGSKNLEEFFIKSKLIKISNAGLLESHPHSILISATGSNYNIS